MRHSESSLSVLATSLSSVSSALFPAAAGVRCLTSSRDLDYGWSFLVGLLPPVLPASNPLSNTAAWSGSEPPVRPSLSSLQITQQPTLPSARITRPSGSALSAFPASSLHPSALDQLILSPLQLPLHPVLSYHQVSKSLDQMFSLPGSLLLPIPLIRRTPSSPPNLRVTCQEKPPSTHLPFWVAPPPLPTSRGPAHLSTACHAPSPRTLLPHRARESTFPSECLFFQPPNS